MKTRLQGNVKKAFYLLAFLFAGKSTPSFSQSLPRPDHLVVCIMENHSYEDIMGSSSAPYINNLASKSALLAESYAVTHPSQPNYLQLFSGSDQGVTDDDPC